MNTRRIAWLSAGDPPELFPDVENALIEPDGLLAAGGDLSTERLLAAYRRGIFPWFDEGQPILWWSPDPRCVLRPEGLRVSKRLTQYARQSSLQLRFNTAFGDVIRTCAGSRRSHQGTWITSDMISAYERLHSCGWAHSVEVVDHGRLVGGLYGLCIGQMFFGESMYSTVDNASKFAMLALAAQMLDHDLVLIDCQVVSQHLITMGATMIPRRAFTALTDRLCEPGTRFSDWPEDELSVSDALEQWRRAALQ